MKLICIKCDIEKPLDDFNIDSRRKHGVESVCKLCRYLQRGKDNIRAGIRRHKIKTRDSVYCAYGGYVCACCGETKPKFLTIDHIDNNGAEHRKAISGPNNRCGSFDVYRWLKANHYPKGFQVLCYNCNCGRHRNGGICPHKDIPHE
jgi:hypothetical protein